MSLKSKKDDFIGSLSKLGSLSKKRDFSEALQDVHLLSKTNQSKFGERNDRVQFDKQLAIIKHIYKGAKEILDINEQNEIINPQIKRLNSAIKECFTAWKSKKQTNHEYDKAVLVFQSYYNESKLRDFLVKMREVIDEAENTDDLKRGYNSYFIFVKKDFESLCKKLEESAFYEVKNSLSSVCGFIDSECKGINMLKELSGLMRNTASLGKSMNEHKAEGRYTLSDSEKDMYKSVTTDWEPWQSILTVKNPKTKSVVDELVEEISKLKDGFVEQQKNLKSEIDKANELYRALKDNITDELFDAFDPKSENGSLDTLPLTELRELYENSVGKNILDKYVNRFEEE